MLANKINPRKITDLVDNIDIYLNVMRLEQDLKEVPKALSEYAWEYFRVSDPSKDELNTFAIFLMDHIYRYAADLTILDEFTKIYFASIFTNILDYLQSRGIDIFYILDNTIRDDRFNLTVLLYALCGVAVVAPYHINGKYLNYMNLEEQAEWALSFKTEDFNPKSVSLTIDNQHSQLSDIENLIHKYIANKRNIIYIEKDDTVNYLNEVSSIARKSTYLGILRNLAPNDPNVTILK